jgi:hypothetical protein
VVFLPVPAPRVSARWAVRRRAVCFDVRAETLTLCSMLSPAAYGVLAREGVLRADRSVVDPRSVEAYDWLCAQARRRLPGAVGGYPIWFWAQIRPRDLLVNVRHAARYDPGSVLVVCRIRRQRCLLSSYDDWHCVLDGSPLVPWPKPTRADPAADPEEWARWQRRLADAFDRMERALAAAGVPRHPVSGWPAELRAQVERGWEHIFDLAAYPPEEYWQATVEELRAGDVVAAGRPVWWL